MFRVLYTFLSNSSSVILFDPIRNLVKEVRQITLFQFYRKGNGTVKIRV